jgi:GYD domain
VASAGGSVESLYFALGEDDAYVICNLPDNVAAAATAMSAAATGMVVNWMVAPLTAEEVDRAAGSRLSYDAPGSGGATYVVAAYVARASAWRRPACHGG